MPSPMAKKTTGATARKSCSSSRRGRPRSLPQSQAETPPAEPVAVKRPVSASALPWLSKIVARKSTGGVPFNRPVVVCKTARKSTGGFPPPRHLWENNQHNTSSENGVGETGDSGSDDVEASDEEVLVKKSRRGNSNK